MPERSAHTKIRGTFKSQLKSLSNGIIWDNSSIKTVEIVINDETIENIRTHEVIPIMKRQVNKKEDKVP